ncbi:MAG UNVERIFIED_CONTAM: NAD-glutamate dehydrogenase [Rickettsiaceae bacterium]|jgi:glutamate dehydrogenase
MPRYIEQSTPSQLVCENPAYRKHIIDTSLKQNSSESFASFVQKFYSYLPVDYMEEKKIDFFADMAHESFSFVTTRKKDETKITFMTDDHGKYGGDVLQIVTPDRPFIIDALKYIIKRHNISINIFMHPLMSITRSNEGQIKSIGEDKNYESVMFIILSEVKASIQKKIIDEFLQTINKIDLVVKANPEIKQKLENIIKGDFCKDDDIDFLKWIIEENFTFLASIDFDERGNLINGIGDNSTFDQDMPYLQDLVKRVITTEIKELLLGKMNKASELNSGRYIDYILVENNNGGGILFWLLYN